MIHPDMEIEELVRKYPFSVRYMMEQGIKCIACGEPIWGTLAEAAREKGYGQADINRFVDEMNAMALQMGSDGKPSDIKEIDIEKLDL